jgi:hypothetical protein
VTPLRKAKVSWDPGRRAVALVGGPGVNGTTVFAVGTATGHTDAAGEARSSEEVREAAPVWPGRTCGRSDAVPLGDQRRASWLLKARRWLLLARSRLP